jgi:hypothetical protein
VIFRLYEPLPWENWDKDSIVSAKKNIFSYLFPYPHLGQYFRYLYNHQPHEPLDYQYLRSIFTKKLRVMNDGIYDWNVEQLRETCKKQTLQMLEKIGNLVIGMARTKGQVSAEFLEGVLKAYRYVLKIQFPSYIPGALSGRKSSTCHRKRSR